MTHLSVQRPESAPHVLLAAIEISTGRGRSVTSAAWRQYERFNSVAQCGVPISPEQARGPMGRAKRDHITDILFLPEVALRWQKDPRGATDLCRCRPLVCRLSAATTCDPARWGAAHSRCTPNGARAT